MSELEKNIQEWEDEHFKKFEPSDIPAGPIRSKNWNTYDLPPHDQGDKNSCTAHAVAMMFEMHLSNDFREPVSIDGDDLWEKQLKFGTATEDGDDFVGVLYIADKYGMKFETKSGIKGILKPSSGVEILEDALPKKARFGAANINSKNLKDGTINSIVDQEYLYSHRAMVVSAFVVALGVLLILLNSFGIINFEIEVLGLKGKLLNASPGIVVVFIGLIILFVTRPSIKIK